jgi:1-acyl-sn-glycerol-3-phosphate acyltransferase
MSTDRSVIARTLDALRSLLFYSGYAVSVIVYGLFMVILGARLDYPRRYRMLMVWNRVVIRWLRLVCGVDYRISGLDNLRGSSCVVVSNHQSSWETIFLATLFPQLCILLKRELLRIPFFGWALALMRPIAIDRSNPRAALKQVVEQGAERLAEGCSVLIFPEGTRVDAGQSLRFSRSAAQLAIRAGVDIVCVAHDAGNCWPARRFSKTPGTVNVAISAPMSSADTDSGRLTQLAQSWIEQRLQEFTASGTPG